MPAKHNFTIHKLKLMVCGHRQYFSTPVPQPGEVVWCLTCDKSSSIPKKKYNPNAKGQTIASGRPRRLTENPRSNNQYTKGRRLSNG